MSKVSRVFSFEKCSKCGGHFGLSMLASNDGRLDEVRIRPLRDPDTDEVLPGPLVFDGTGIYCRDCGTHVTEAEELAARSIAEPPHAQHP